MRIKGHIVCVITNSKTGEKRVLETKNIVTNDGDAFYAHRATKATPAKFVDGGNAFNGKMELYNGASAAPGKTDDRDVMVGLVTGSGQAIDATYPKLNDGDSDNTGAGAEIVTYRVSYALGALVATGIADVVIGEATPGAGTKLLMHALFGAPFDMTALDSLKCFCNHAIAGV